MKTGVYLTLSEAGERQHYALQVSINYLNENGNGIGYRLFGPKFLGDSTDLRQKRLSERDIQEILTLIAMAKDNA